MIEFFAELIMMGGGRGDDGRGAIGNEANISTVAAEKVFVFEGELPACVGSGARGII